MSRDADVPTKLTLSGPILIRFGGPKPWPFSGKLTPQKQWPGVIRLVYTWQKTGYSFPHEVMCDVQGEYQDDPPDTDFENMLGAWEAQAFFDGQIGYAPSKSPVHVFMVDD